MMLLRALLIALIIFIGLTDSLHVRSIESVETDEEIDSEYRPWDRSDGTKTWISLDGMGIDTLSSMFQLAIPNLTWLVMDNNRIERIPSEAFKNFPDLTYISLAGNQIREIKFGAFDGLEKLEVLDLDRNPISNNVVSAQFETLTGLKSLYLRHCEISSFEPPGNIEHLSHLHLSGNVLRMFYFRNGSALTHLHLDNNRLSYVSLSQLKSLTYINLNKNQLNKITRQSKVPPSYYARNFHQRSYYYGNNPNDDSGLYLDGASVLERLIVSSNQLSRIDSDTFLDTESLVYVDLSENQITEVFAGTFNNLLQLENIILDSNRIKQINHRAFVNLPNLKIISLKNNQIDDVDEDAFTKLNSSANEVYLFLDNNQIHTLRRGSFRDIEGLKHIGLSNNRIKTISSHAFANLPNLESIVIENQLRDQVFDDSDGYRRRPLYPMTGTGIIESNAFFNLSNLVSITIRGNLFTDIESKAFHELPKLTVLDLSNNSISNLSHEAFYDLPAVENLYLGKNRISEIEPKTFPKQLKHLDLAGNRVCREFSCWHVEELHQLEELDVSGIINRFKVEDFEGFPKNLSVIVGEQGDTLNIPLSPPW